MEQETSREYIEEIVQEDGSILHRRIIERLITRDELEATQASLRTQLDDVENRLAESASKVVGSPH